MKKPSFEEELLRTLQDQMQGPSQAAARVRVSKRLEATFVGLDLGLANLASLPSSAPAAKTAVLKASAGKLGGLGAAKVAAAAPALSMSTHPIATLLATFAVGAVAGTGIMVASEVVSPPSKAPSALSAQPRMPQASDARRRAGVARAAPAPAARVAPAESALPALQPAPEPVQPSVPNEARATAPAARQSAPTSPVRKPESVDKTRAASSTPPTASMANALSAQQSLLDRAREELARGDGEGALSSLAQHEHEFASTLLEEERLSLKIKSLMASGRDNDARALAADFATRFPHSLLLPSIQAVMSKNP